MVARIYKSFSKYGLKLPIIFIRWKGRGLIYRFKANKLLRLNVNIFYPYVNTKFSSLYIKEENDINRILNGERKILFYDNDDYKKYDIKSRWELNRYHHAPVAALYYKSFNDDILDEIFNLDNLEEIFIETNAMEVSISSINIITAFSLLAKERKEKYSDSVSAFLKKSIVYIFNNIEKGVLYSANHYFFNILGILWICESVNNENNFLLKIKNEYYKELENLLDQFILKDGSLYEGSTYYHKYVTESLLLFLHEFDSKVTNQQIRETCQRMVRFAKYASYNDKLIGIGDSDSGRILPLPSYYNYRSIDLSLINKLSSLLKFNTNDALEVLEYKDNDFGLYILKDSLWHAAIRLETGNREYRKHIGGHCHNDQLHVSLFHQNQPLLVDTGVYSYISKDSLRVNALKTSSHNTVQISSYEQNSIHNSFMYSERTSIANLYDYNNFSFKGSHSGYRNLNINHIREVLLKDDKIIIMDLIKSSIIQEKLKYTVFYHLHPDCIINKINNDVIEFSCNSSFFIMQFSEVNDIKISKSYYSPEYGCVYNNNVLKFMLNLKKVKQSVFTISLRKKI